MRYRAGVERATTSGFHLGGKRWLAVVTFGLCGSYWQGGSSITHLWCCKSNRLSRPEWDREEIGLFPPASCSTLNIQLSNNSVKLVDGRWCHDLITQHHIGLIQCFIYDFPIGSFISQELQFYISSVFPCMHTAAAVQRGEDFISFLYCIIVSCRTDGSHTCE